MPFVAFSNRSALYHRIDSASSLTTPLLTGILCQFFQTGTTQQRQVLWKRRKTSAKA
jgi:hypothetical protein